MKSNEFDVRMIISNSTFTMKFQRYGKPQYIFFINNINDLKMDFIIDN